MDINDNRVCQYCGKDITAEENEQFDGFCNECDSEGACYCEKCGKPMKDSKYDSIITGLICNDCQ